MRWEWVVVAIAAVVVIRMVWFSIGNARARRSTRYIAAATSVMKEIDHFAKQFSRLYNLDNSEIAVASLRLQELSHQVRSWDPPARDREMHRHLMNIVACAAAEWKGAPDISMEEANARLNRTNAAVREYLKTRGGVPPDFVPPRQICTQTRISAFLFGNRC